MNGKELIFAKLQEDEGFLNAIISSGDPIAVQKVLSAHNIELSLEEIEEIFKTGKEEIARFADSDNTELGEEDLEVVSGGGIVRGLARVAVSSALVYGYSLIVGVYPPAIIAAPALAGSLGLWCKAGVDKKGW